ncbi:MAG: hypothetical protein AAF570_03665 [Bacteroidota bacterium]
MKFSGIQKKFLILALVLTAGFAFAGMTGFRVLSVFNKQSYSHTGGPGVYPPYGVVYHK